MKILWLTNVVLPEFCGEYNIKKTYSGGWMTGMLSKLNSVDDIEIELCFPIIDESKVRDGKYGGIVYYSLWMGRGERKKEEIAADAKKIINKSRPDIVHIWGSEFEHAHIMCEVLKEIHFQNVILDIQGIQFFISERYTKGIPDDWIDYSSEKDVPSILELNRRSMHCAEAERRCFISVDSFIGRTRWDKNYVIQVNSNACYFHCDRILREAFYKTSRFWDYGSCEKHSVFISQAGSTYKGVHFFLQAMTLLVPLYPDIKIYIGGDDSYINGNKLGRKTPYGEYILYLIRKYELDPYIVFRGRLDDQAMIEEYLRANVFCSCSITENNSNSTCEAQYIGTPVISSYVGGMGDIVEDKKTGLLYCYDDIRMLAGLLCYAFDYPDEMIQMSKNERVVAAKRHEPSHIVDNMNAIYRAVLINGTM